MPAIVGENVVPSTNRLLSAMSATCSPATRNAISFAKEFCRVMQKRYSSIGTMPMSEHAKKPLRMLSIVFFTLPRPFWYSMAKSNTATITPAMNSPHPNSVNR